MDAQGPERVRPYMEEAGATFTCAVDAENQLGETFNFKAIPNGVLIDEEGAVDFIKLGGFDIRKPEYADLVGRWIAGAPAEELSDPAQGNRDLSIKQPQALEHFRQGLALYRQGKAQEALAEWRRRMVLEPDNFVIRKQIWAVEHPERFYQGPIDTDWQREQRERNQ